MTSSVANGLTNKLWPIGESYIRQAILDHVSSSLPTVHQGMIDQTGLQPNDFPIFSRVDYDGPPRGGLGGSEYALLSLAVMSVSNFQTIDIDSMGMPMQQAQYRVRLYSFVKADAKPPEDPDTTVEYGYKRVVRLRGLTEAAVRSVLLSRPSLGTDTGFLRAETLSAQFSDIQSVKGQRWVSGVYHEFVFQNEEGQVSQPLGYVESVDVRVVLFDDNVVPASIPVRVR